MKLKQLLSLLLLLIFSSAAFAQSENPFASIGKKGKILTLTKGQYDETFDADTIQQIGSSLINVRTMKMVKLLTDDESKKRLEGEKHSRFLSVDPLTRSFAYYTPYQYAGNTPIQAIDLDGLEPLSMVDATGKLTTPVITLLNEVFTFSQVSLQSTTWINYKNGNKLEKAYAKIVGIGKGVTATTVFKTVIHDGSTTRSDDRWLSLIAHEQTHRQQIENSGTIALGIDIWEQVKAGKESSKTFEETQAYQIGGNWNGYDYMDDLLKYNNGEALTVLNGQGTSADKSSKMKAIGVGLKRDVLLPKLISETKDIVESLEITIGLNKSTMSKPDKKIYDNLLEGSKAHLKELNTELTKLKETKTP